MFKYRFDVVFSWYGKVNKGIFKKRQVDYVFDEFQKIFIIAQNEGEAESKYFKIIKSQEEYVRGKVEQYVHHSPDKGYSFKAISNNDRTGYLCLTKGFLTIDRVEVKATDIRIDTNYLIAPLTVCVEDLTVRQLKELMERI